MNFMSPVDYFFILLPFLGQEETWSTTSRYGVEL